MLYSSSSVIGVFLRTARLNLAIERTSQRRPPGSCPPIERDFFLSSAVHSTQSFQTACVSAVGSRSPASRAVSLTSTSEPSAIACARV